MSKIEAERLKAEAAHMVMDDKAPSLAAVPLFASPTIVHEDKRLKNQFSMSRQAGNNEPNDPIADSQQKNAAASDSAIDVTIPESQIPAQVEGDPWSNCIGPDTTDEDKLHNARILYPGIVSTVSENPRQSQAAGFGQVNVPKQVSFATDAIITTNEEPTQLDNTQLDNTQPSALRIQQVQQILETQRQQILGTHQQSQQQQPLQQQQQPPQSQA